MSRKLKIAIDQDGILADLLTPWFELYNDEYKDTLSVEDIHSWDTHKFVKEECGTAIYKYLNKSLYKRLPPIPGAREAIAQLKEKHDIVIITASPRGCMNAKADWLKEHMGLDMDYFMAGRKKYFLKADVLIDDSPKNIKTYKDAHLGSKVVTIGYPYNMDCKDVVDLWAPSWADTESAWCDILDYIDNLSEEFSADTIFGGK